MERYEAYKDSGVEWIGEIPEHWEVLRSKVLCRFWNGLTYSPDDVADTGMLVLRSSNIQDGILVYNDCVYVNTHVPEKAIAKKGDVLICSRNGSRQLIGKNALIERDGDAFGAFMMIARPICESRYFYYLLNGGVFDYYLPTYLTSTVNQLTGGNFGQMYVPYSASTREQRAIADYLDAKTAEIDALVADCEREVGLLREYRKAVISEAVTKGLDPDAPMRDSGVEWIGEIPEGWRFGKITSIIDRSHPYAMGDGDHGTIKAESYLETGIPFIRVQNLDWGTELNLNNLVYISEADNEPIRNSTLRPGDILFAKTGATIGKTGMVPESMPISNTTSHVGKITVSEHHNSRFYLYVLASTIGYTQLWAIASQKTTRPELSIDETKTLIVPIPASKSEEKAVADYLDAKTAEIDSLIDAKQSMVDKLREYRKSLISEAVTGKFRIPGVR